MKKNNVFVLPLLSLLVLTGCGKTSSEVSSTPTSGQVTSSKKEETSSSNKTPDEQKITMTFKWNFEGQGDTSAQQEEGTYLAFPEMKSRKGYLFSYWSLDSEGKQVFDLSEKITAAKTLYANWIADDGNAVTVTFHTDMEGENDIYMQMSIQKNSRLKSFPAIERKNHLFKGWYTSKTYEKTISKTAKFDVDSDIYARWYNQEVMEAEYTKLTDLTRDEDPNINDFGEKIGHGYSSDVSGTGLIFKENANLKASNGYFINDLYYEGAFIQFDFTCDKQLADASLSVTLSAEYFDMTFTKDNWKVEVNGQSIDYPQIVLDNVPTGRDTALKRAFTTHNITNTLSLKQGQNTIKLITNNHVRHDSTGTMAAEAPMIDYLTLYSDAKVEFDAHTDNLSL